MVKCGDVSLKGSRSHAHLDGKGRWHMYTMGSLRRQVHTSEQASAFLIHSYVASYRATRSQVNMYRMLISSL